MDDTDMDVADAREDGSRRIRPLVRADSLDANIAIDRLDDLALDVPLLASDSIVGYLRWASAPVLAVLEARLPSRRILLPVNLPPHVQRRPRSLKQNARGQPCRVVVAFPWEPLRNIVEFLTGGPDRYAAKLAEPLAAYEEEKEHEPVKDTGPPA